MFLVVLVIKAKEVKIVKEVTACDVLPVAMSFDHFSFFLTCPRALPCLAPHQPQVGLIVVGILLTGSCLGHGHTLEERAKAGGLGRKLAGPALVAAGLLVTLLRSHFYVLGNEA